MDRKCNEIALRPSDIRYTQSTVSNKFRDGTLISSLLDDIVIGRCFISEIKRIEVKLVDGVCFSADNRRLWVFKQLECLGHCPLVTVKVVKRINWAKCTSTNGGMDVSIRGGQPGGICYLKDEEIQQMPKHDPSVSDKTNDKIGLEKSKLCSSKTLSFYDIQSSKCPVFQPTASQFVPRNSSDVQLDRSEGKQSMPGTNESKSTLQVKDLKKKRRSKRTKTKKGTVKTPEAPMEVSSIETDNYHSDGTPLTKNDDETNEKPNTNIRKRRRRSKKRTIKKDNETELFTEQGKGLTYLFEVQGDIQSSTACCKVTELDVSMTHSIAHDNVAVHRHDEAVVQISHFETNDRKDNTYNAVANVDDGDDNDDDDNDDDYNYNEDRDFYDDDSNDDYVVAVDDKDNYYNADTDNYDDVSNDDHVVAIDDDGDYYYHNEGTDYYDDDDSNDDGVSVFDHDDDYYNDDRNNYDGESYEDAIVAVDDDDNYYNEDMDYYDGESNDDDIVAVDDDVDHYNEVRDNYDGESNDDAVVDDDNYYYNEDRNNCEDETNDDDVVAVDDDDDYYNEDKDNYDEESNADYVVAVDDDDDYYNED